MNFRKTLLCSLIAASFGQSAPADETEAPAGTAPAAEVQIGFIDAGTGRVSPATIGLIREFDGQGNVIGVDVIGVDFDGQRNRGLSGEDPDIHSLVDQAQHALNALHIAYQSAGMDGAADQVLEQLAALEQLRALPLPEAPATLRNLDKSPREFRGKVGETVYLRVEGSEHGSVWGSGPYTDDSNLGAAAVHAGILEPGEQAIVAVKILAGEASYSGSEANGVRSSSWGGFPGSFQVLSKGIELGDASTLRGRSESMNVYVTGNTEGVVWGSDVYTDDSDIGAAAVHAGLLKSGESGFVRLTTAPGLQQYTGGTRNDVTTRDYRAWSGSFVLSPSEPVQAVNDSIRYLNFF